MKLYTSSVRRRFAHIAICVPMYVQRAFFPLDDLSILSFLTKTQRLKHPIVCSTIYRFVNVILNRIKLESYFKIKHQMNNELVKSRIIKTFFGIKIRGKSFAHKCFSKMRNFCDHLQTQKEIERFLIVPL